MSRQRSEWLPIVQLDPVAQRKLVTVKRWYDRAVVITALVAVLLVALIFKIDETRVIVNDRQVGTIERDGWAIALELVVLAMPLVLSAVIFSWSWYAYQNARQGREIIEKAWTGKHVIFKSVVEHICELDDALTREDASNISEVRLMLSTLAYGIQDKEGPDTIRRLAAVLKQWLESLPRKQKGKKPVLSLYLWGEQDHGQYWGIRDGASDWHRRGGDVTHEFLLALKELRDTLTLMRGGSQVDVRAYPIRHSDLRFFIVQREPGIDWGMVVTFADFTRETADEHNYVNMGFITRSDRGVAEMMRMVEKFRTRGASVLPGGGDILDNLDEYFVQYFQLNEVGGRQDWSSCIKEITTKVVSFHEQRAEQASAAQSE